MKKTDRQSNAKSPARRLPAPPAAMPVTQLVSRVIVRVIEGRLVPVRAVVAHAA